MAAATTAITATITASWRTTWLDNGLGTEATITATITTNILFASIEATITTGTATQHTIATTGRPLNRLWVSGRINRPMVQHHGLGTTVCQDYLVLAAMWYWLLQCYYVL